MKRRLFPCSLLVLALIAAACSSGDDGSSGSSDSTTTSPVDEPATPPEDTSQDTRNVGVESGLPDGSFLFDQEALHTFEISLSEENLAFLDADPAAEVYVEGQVTFDGETRTVGVRYKGGVGAWVNCLEGTQFGGDFSDILNPSGAKTCPKLSIKLKINWENSNDEWHGQRKFQFHSMNLDPTQMRDRLGYWLFREMGVPAPRATHARIMMNGEYMGVFSMVEQIDGRFARQNFEDGTGNLYKEVWPLNSDGQPVTDVGFSFGLKTNEKDDPSFDLIRTFAEDMSAATAEDRAEVVARWVDVETMLAYFAVERTINHDDSLSNWRCFGGGCTTHNFYLYEDPTAERFQVIPWDLDNAFQTLRSGPANAIIYVVDDFGEITDDCEPFSTGSFALQRSAACDPIIGAVADYSDEYRQVLDDFLAGPFDEERVSQLVETWADQITEATQEAADTHGQALSLAAWDASLDALLVDLETARADSAG